MSIFKNKDDFITSAFKSQFNSDSDSSDDESEDRVGKSLDDTDDTQNSASKRIKISDDECIDELADLPKGSCVAIERAEHNQEPVEYHDVDDNDSSIITLSDDEPPKTCTSINIISSQSVDDDEETTIYAFDESDRDYNLKLMISGEFRKFQTTYGTKLRLALKDLLDEIRERKKRLIIRSNDESQTISLEESPFSLGLTPATILYAIEVGGVDDDCSEPPQETDENMISIKLQDGNRKHTKEYRINKTEPLKLLKELYAKDYDISCVDDIKLSFDGDIIESDDTAIDLDIDDGCIIDVIH